MYSKQINFALGKLREGGRVVTNVYTTHINDNINTLLKNENAILIVCKDHAVSRLYYYAVSLKSLNDLLLNLPKEEYVLEFITRNPEQYSDFLRELGFKCLKRMMRMSTWKNNLDSISNSVTQYYDETIGIYPDVSLAKEINQVLWNVFDTRVSHLQNDEELKASIANKEVLIHQSKDGQIDAVLQTVIQPQRFYINQVYNSAEKKIIHAMLQKRLKVYTKSGGKYIYAWVADDNIASIKFHQKYGLCHDGTWSLVYTLKRE